MQPRIESAVHWRARHIDALPPRWQPAILGRYLATARDDERAANLWLLDACESLALSRLPLNSTDDDIIATASSNAAAMWSFARASRATDPAALRAVLAAALARHDITAPAGADITDAGAVARMLDPLWWRRALRREHAPRLEATAIDLGLVHRRAQIYASDETVARRDQQARRNARTLAATLAINDDGEAYTLAELAARTVSNPTIRRGELMTRARGFEEVAADLGHVAEFVTITCPPRMHPRRAASGARNDAYDGTTPRDAQSWLARAWQRCRAALARAGITPYGFRVAEPHHDATPHWHCLFFLPARDAAGRAQVPRFRAIVRTAFLRADMPAPPRLDALRASGLSWRAARAALRAALVDAEHQRRTRQAASGETRYRIRFEAIDTAKGTATGYIAKYIAKNIDGYAVQLDAFGNDAITSAGRVLAWASTWRIRQFAQIGGPPVGIWRQLRKLDPVTPDHFGGGAAIEAAREAADAGDWRAYVKAMGGPTRKRAARPIQQTAEAPDTLTRYGEPSPPRPSGLIESWSQRAVSYVRRAWEIVTRAAVALRLTWTRVNNCTQVTPSPAALKEIEQCRTHQKTPQPRQKSTGTTSTPPPWLTASVRACWQPSYG